jgi:hypothetical protein
MHRIGAVQLNATLPIPDYWGSFPLFLAYGERCSVCVVITIREMRFLTWSTAESMDLRYYFT